ncbi:MAG: nitrile hydratase subunit alpha [Gammaproteobacteria bacterium]|nr:MAG: nitrile hydratase subunit alpha [Gammaproteobacteria bacterium]
MTHDDHDHDHDSTEAPSDIELRVKALESLLVDKGLVDPAALDELVDTYEHRVGPQNGAHVVAKAWVDSTFREYLLATPSSAIASLGYSGRQGEHIRVLENTDSIHNLVVCTLCSCYPWPFPLGCRPNGINRVRTAPAQSASREKFSKGNFGTHLGKNVSIQGFWGSTSELRYLVLPQRPSNTEDLTETELRQLVTRNSMIGVETLKAFSGTND